MKNKYVTPELEVTKFSVENELLASVVEDKTLPGFGEDLDNDGRNTYSIKGKGIFSGPGFGWDD